MKLSVVVPTRGDQNMKNIIACLQAQTFTDFEVVFVLDKTVTSTEGRVPSDHRIHFITNLNSDFRSKRDVNDSKIGGNASELRNYGIRAAKGEFILLMDDDEWFEDDYLDRYLDLWEKYKKIVGQDFVLCPTLMYRRTGHVQNYGFSHFNYWLSRPEMAKMGHREWIPVQMYSGNSLLAPAYIFKDHQFDERLDFVAEDLDFTRGLTIKGVPMIVLRDLKIYHMEGDKNTLQQARIGNEYAAYRKAKHRRIFVQKYASWRNRIPFFLTGRFGQAGRLAIKAMIYAKGGDKWKIIRGVVRGTFCKI